MIKWIILIGQVGRIWSKRRKTKQIYQTISVLGFFLLLAKKKSDNSTVDPNERAIRTQVNEFNNFNNN